MKLLKESIVYYSPPFIEFLKWSINNNISKIGQLEVVNTMNEVKVPYLLLKLNDFTVFPVISMIFILLILILLDK
jgi:hypothetical protein